jgi:putative spermidine/putrescine transport system permease protein
MTGVTVQPAQAGSSAGKPRRTPFRLAAPSWVLPALVFLLIFFVIPLFANLLRSVTYGETVKSGHLYYYIKIFTDAYYAGVLLETLEVATITTLLCLVIGYPVSYFMVRYARRWNSVILFCLIAPLLTSIIMRTFGWSVLFGRRGPINLLLLQSGLIDRPLDVLNKPTMVYIGLVHVLVPFMVLSITSVLQNVDIRLEEAARILGASRASAFFRITLPLSLDGVATGCILVFVLTNGSFLTMLLLGGGSVRTFSLLIFQQFSITQDIGFAATMGNVLLFIALVSIYLQTRFVRRKGVKS